MSGITLASLAHPEPVARVCPGALPTRARAGPGASESCTRPRSATSEFRFDDVPRARAVPAAATSRPRPPATTTATTTTTPRPAAPTSTANWNSVLDAKEAGAAVWHRPVELPLDSVRVLGVRHIHKRKFVDLRASDQDFLDFPVLAQEFFDIQFVIALGNSTYPQPYRASWR